MIPIGQQQSRRPTEALQNYCQAIPGNSQQCTKRRNRRRTIETSSLGNKIDNQASEYNLQERDQGAQRALCATQKEALCKNSKDS